MGDDGYKEWCDCDNCDDVMMSMTMMVISMVATVNDGDNGSL